VERCGGALILALEGGSGAAGARTARWIAALPTGVSTSSPFVAPVGAVEALRRRAFTLPGGRGAGDLLRQASGLLSAAAATGPRVITNDISPHMFFSAGLWGLPTREDARRLSRTFGAGSLDMVIFAYGTHHVSGIDQAIRESFAILRPGGHIVLQDFLDEGPVGRWFHDVVDPYSRTGHDFVHIGPIQLAVQLLLAGFRDVRMFEMEDPFMFAVPPGSARGAREVACTYLLGMYGLGDSHLRERHCLEGQIREILSYGEIGNTPRFEEDFVYIPRRATGASAIRPGSRHPALSPADCALVEALTALLTLEPMVLARRYGAPPELLGRWFRPDGSRWGLAAREVAAWREWVA
jgi:SAM-dependent methyltransferase